MHPCIILTSRGAKICQASHLLTDMILIYVVLEYFAEYRGEKGETCPLYLMCFYS